MHVSEYEKKLTTAQEAVSHIRDNDMLVYGMVMAEPPALLSAAANRLLDGDLKKLRVYNQLPYKYAQESILSPKLYDCVETYTGFVGSGDRGAVSVGLDQYMPNHFHQTPRLLTEFLGVDVVMATVSPMDDAGYFSFGTTNDFLVPSARAARLLIVEVNEHMPRVFGQSLVHVTEVDRVVENSVPLLELAGVEITPEHRVIAKTIAEMVPDNATLQIGWGGLPGAVVMDLENHQNLGIHTEVFSPSVIPLMKKGVINGAKKNLHPRKHVYTVAIGNREMTEYMDNNPAMASYPVDHVNHPAVIAQNDNMISINSILEVDLLGQCNAEFMGGNQFSGTGGQLDFVRGAFDSKGGKSILAFLSTAKKGTLSRVVPRLPEGTAVTTPRQDVHWLVTEHGAANLKGKTVGQRALAIIDLADPQFRDGLLRAAEDMRLL